ncbi:MAG: hypothetical protein ACTSRA_10110 [Promethearchaeota archaeon]
MSDINSLKKELEEIAQEYNDCLEKLTNIANEKGEEAAIDPEYVQLYARYEVLAARYEEVQAMINELTTSEVQAETPSPGIDADSSATGTEQLEPEVQVNVSNPVEAEGTPETGAIQPEMPSETVEMPSSGTEVEAEAPPAPPPPPSLAEPEMELELPKPKYKIIERVRVEENKIYNQVWSFVGYSSKITPVLNDLVNKAGYITKNILEKSCGHATILLPFKVNFPIGIMFEQALKKRNKPVGLIYYPHEFLDDNILNNINQSIQQFLASVAPKCYRLFLTKLNEPTDNDDDSTISMIVGGLTDQDANIKKSLRTTFRNVHFDNEIFYQGAWLDAIKNFTERLGIRVITLVSTSNVFKNIDNLQKFLDSI